MLPLSLRFGTSYSFIPLIVETLNFHTTYRYISNINWQAKGAISKNCFAIVVSKPLLVFSTVKSFESDIIFDAIFFGHNDLISNCQLVPFKHLTFCGTCSMCKHNAVTECLIRIIGL